MVNWLLPALLVAVPGSAGGKVPDCRSVLLQPAEAPARRPGAGVTPRDLAELIDFGPQESAAGGEPPFSVSPDGTRAALALRRGDPATDSYCMGVVVVSLSGSEPPKLIDVGGEPILAVSDVRGLADLPIGNLHPVTPAWSPNGRSLAFLRRDGGRTQAWRAAAYGSRSEPVSALDADARSVRWSGDGRSLIVRTRPGIQQAQPAIDTEERQGFLFDRRFWPLSAARPVASASIPEVETEVPTDGGKSAPHIGSLRTSERYKPAGAIRFARSSKGDSAWTAPLDPKVFLGAAPLHASYGGRTIVCRFTLCSDAVATIWWRDHGTLFFVQGGTAANGGRTTLARWRPATEPTPTVILSTVDALLGCGPAAKVIVCARETAIHPRTLVRIDPDSGRITTIFDPNPEFAALVKGDVRRLRWRLADGTQSYGDLVLPPGHRAGDRHPLIVVQYRSRGFLRGGTGDEYPIHALATRGFTVLSIERTPFVGAGKATSREEFVRMGAQDFAERRRTLASIEAGVAQAVALGVVDRERVGITGLSDGAATVQFALVNSDLFRVAAVSSCCDEPSTTMFAADRGYSEMLIAAGFPAPGSDGKAFWQRYSLAANAARLKTPILMQLPEDEFRFGLETFVTLDHHRIPVEMHIYADAYHQKWRPAQRLASYERAIDWFDFWFNGKSDASPAKAAQYERWRALAARQSR